MTLSCDSCGGQGVPYPGDPTQGGGEAILTPPLDILYVLVLESLLPGSPGWCRINDVGNLASQIAKAIPSATVTEIGAAIEKVAKSIGENPVLDDFGQVVGFEVSE